MGLAVSILVAGIVSMVLGMIWYNPKVFGNTWAKLAGVKIDEAKKKGMCINMLYGFIGTLIFAWVLNSMLGVSGAADPASAAKLGFFLWLGFIATTQIGSFLWERKPFTLFLINTAYSLVNIVLVGLVLVWL